MTTTPSSAAAIGNAIPHIPTIPQEASNEASDSADSRVGEFSQREFEPLEALLVELMRKGWLSPQDALRQAGTMSLAQRISEMRREHPELNIVDEWRQAGRSRFKAYTLLEKA